MKCFASEEPAIPSSPPEPNESFFDSRLQELGGVGDPKLFHHICSVRLDGFDANLQASADLAILQAIPNQLKNLLLPFCQRGDAVSFPFFHPLWLLFRQFRTVDVRNPPETPLISHNQVNM
jgi:hypothetical protein